MDKVLPSNHIIDQDRIDRNEEEVRETMRELLGVYVIPEMTSKGFTFKDIVCHTYQDDLNDLSRIPRINASLLDIVSIWTHPTEGENKFITVFWDVCYSMEEKHHICSKFENFHENEYYLRGFVNDDEYDTDLEHDDQADHYTLWDFAR